MWFASVLLCLALFSSAPALAQEAPSREEVISEVARVTGLASDAVSQALGDNPEWIDKLGTAVAAAQVVDKLLSGKDSEILTDFVTEKLTEAAEKFVEKVLPSGVTGFISAVKLYRDALEFVRDYAFIPALDANVYAEYKRARGGKTDYSYASPSEAFDQAIYNAFGPNSGLQFKGYWPQYDDQYQKLLKSKDYNPDLVGEPLEKHLKSRLDAFWAERMEVAYLQDLLKPQKDDLLGKVWASVQDILDQLGQPAGIDAGLFPNPGSDLPGGWWQVDKGDFAAMNRGPVAEETGSESQGYFAASQGFVMSNVTAGYAYDGKARMWCRYEGKRKICDMPVVHVNVVVWRLPDAKIARASTDATLNQTGSTRLSDAAGWRTMPDVRYTILDFALGPYTAHFVLGGSETFGQPSLDLAKHFGRVVARRIKARAGAAVAGGIE